MVGHHWNQSRGNSFFGILLTALDNAFCVCMWTRIFFWGCVDVDLYFLNEGRKHSFQKYLYMHGVNCFVCLCSCIENLEWKLRSCPLFLSCNIINAMVGQLFPTLHISWDYSGKGCPGRFKLTRCHYNVIHTQRILNEISGSPSRSSWIIKIMIMIWVMDVIPVAWTTTLLFVHLVQSKYEPCYTECNCTDM